MGSRFQKNFYLRQRWRKQRQPPSHARVFNFVSGLALVAVGFMLAWIIVAMGLTILASESLTVARFLDRCEVKLRELAVGTRTAWKRLPAMVKVLLSLTCTAAIAYAAYSLASWWPR